MNITTSLPALFLGLVAYTTAAVAQNLDALPHSLPENEGVSSKAILQFVKAADSSKTSFHSFMLLRHGKVIAEAWWHPYKPTLRHSLYSCSKSFTATAVGFALQEKLLSLSDKVVSFFPGLVSDTANSKLQHLTIKDVLMMSDGQEPDPSFKTALDSNWARAFLSTPLKYEPGTTFLYNSLGTYMLSAIVQKVSGQAIVDYLKPRLFIPLGITGMDWETDTKGVNTGGWGLRLKTEDMAKFAQLFLQKGKWNGRQILPLGWVEEASTFKILQDPNAPQTKKDSSDWLQGYCYQMWRCRNNAYRGDGAFGQFMIVMPDQDAVIAITAETPDMQDEINLVWKYLLPSFKAGKLPSDKAAQSALTTALHSLAVPVAANPEMSGANTVNGRKYIFKLNEAGIKSVAFAFDKKVCSILLQTGKATYPLHFAQGKWAEGVTEKPGPSLVARAIENTAFLYPAKVAGRYSWKDKNTLQLQLRYIESPHMETYSFHFEGSHVLAEVAQSLDFGSHTLTVTGDME